MGNGILRQEASHAMRNDIETFKSWAVRADCFNPFAEFRARVCVGEERFSANMEDACRDSFFRTSRDEGNHGAFLSKEARNEQDGVRCVLGWHFGDGFAVPIFNGNERAIVPPAFGKNAGRSLQALDGARERYGELWNGRKERVHVLSFTS